MDRLDIIQSEKKTIIPLARFDEVSLVSACFSLSYTGKSRANPNDNGRPTFIISTVNEKVCGTNNCEQLSL